MHYAEMRPDPAPLPRKATVPRRRRSARGEAPGFGSIVGQSSAMARMYRQIEDVAPTDATVLIVGESGTGKELVARSLWEHSPRVGAPFVGINCGGIPASLL